MFSSPITKATISGRFCTHLTLGERMVRYALESGMSWCSQLNWDQLPFHTCYRYSSSLQSFQIGSWCWSYRCFRCLLKVITVRGQAAQIIYQLEAPARYNCISHRTTFCWAMKYHFDFFNKHHTYGKTYTWKMLLFSFTRYNAVTFKREIRKLFHCVKTELSNGIRK